jgi:GNAT superfamily N-acetyltransferase
MSGSPLRRAQPTDAAEMARLGGELGYPTATDVMAQRLTLLLQHERHLVAVAADGASLRGWLHVEHRFALAGADRAELIALVIDSQWRRGGLGRELVRLAEAWALARGIPTLMVRSNAARAESHPFYEALGYARSKTQHVYSKAVTVAEAAATRTLALLEIKA